ncbi:MAG: helix-turn-helix transcriptional regulator [Ruminococcus sp.]|nr:helix-turn-helix transcriptional regulator [Ruminococcus sp.]
MLSDNIKFLLSEISADNTTIAAYAGCTRAAFSRMRNGTRKYSPGSRTVRKFLEGVYDFAEDTGRLGLLCTLLGRDSGSREELISGLTAWLFSSDPVAERMSRTDPVEFGKKLSTIMALADISGSSLSRELGVDPSYISRIRSGERLPRHGDKLSLQLCRILAESIISRKCQHDLAELVDVPAEFVTEEDAPELIFNWLFEKPVNGDHHAVRALLNIISTLSPVETETLSDAPEVTLKRSVYTGDSGLQDAVRRFLAESAERGSGEIWLYSDRNMDWLASAFRREWAGLMQKCLELGIKVKIIHNIDRSNDELIAAIDSWLPLYLTGGVESMYCSEKSGGRFSHTLFLSPGNACVSGFSVVGAEESAQYEYITSLTRLEGKACEFNMLLSRCRPLLKFSRVPGLAVGSYDIYNLDDIQICIGENDVILNKLTGPFMSFTITHPLLCRSVRSFAETVCGASPQRCHI